MREGADWDIGTQEVTKRFPLIAVHNTHLKKSILWFIVKKISDTLVVR
jgi:hypothetical protein